MTETTNLPYEFPNRRTNSSSSLASGRRAVRTAGRPDMGVLNDSEQEQPPRERGASVKRGGSYASDCAASAAMKHARRFVRANYSVIPLKPRGKEPLNPHGCKEPISRWISFLTFARENRDLNYGIVTGTANGLVVVDVDGEEGEEHLQHLEEIHQSLPATIVVLTGKGRQLYFASDNEKLRNRIGWGPKLDFKGEGGYVVGPGSIHENGAVYRYADGCSWKGVALAPIPAWLESHLLGKTPNAPIAPVAGETIVEGRRNQDLTRLAGELHNTGISGEALLAALSAENAQKCKPPLDEKEVCVIAASVGRYDAHLAANDEAERAMSCLLGEHFADGGNLLSCADGRFWAFDKTHWQVLEGNSLNQKTLSIITGMPERKGTNTSNLMGQVERLLKARCAVQGDPLRFHSEPPLVLNCRNAEIWLNENGEVEQRPHSASSYFRHCFDLDYNAEAHCERYDRAILEIFGKSDDPNSLALFWDELMGYAMQPRRPRAHILIGRGSGSNGKTGLIQLFLKLIGSHSVAALPIDDLEKNRFAIGGLNGKLLLLDDDVKAGTRLPDGPLKKVSEAKVITGEHKFGPSFNFTVRALPMMFTNNQLSIADLSHGLRRRVLVVPFLRQFSKEEADVRLFDTIAANEMSGVFNRYLRGLKRVLAANWTINAPAAVKAATDEFLEQANPLPSFIAEKCEQGSFCLVADLFSHYNSWCQSSGITYRQQRKQFGQNLRNLGYKVDHCKQGDRVHGLRIRSSQSH